MDKERISAETEVSPGLHVEPEFGGLSRLDISALAAALEMHNVQVEALSSTLGVRPLGEPVIKRLISLKKERKLVDDITDVREDRDIKILDRRREALEHAQEIVTSPDYADKRRKIIGQEPDVACLFDYLSGVNNARVGAGLDNTGIELLINLIAPSTERAYTQQAGVTPLSRVHEVHFVNAKKSVPVSRKKPKSKPALHPRIEQFVKKFGLEKK